MRKWKPKAEALIWPRTYYDKITRLKSDYTSKKLNLKNSNRLDRFTLSIGRPIANILYKNINDSLQRTQLNTITLHYN